MPISLFGGAGDDTFQYVYGDSQSPLTPDVIKDFGDGYDLLLFYMDVAESSSWRAEAWEHQGRAGTMVIVTEELPTMDFDRYSVFLEGVSVEEVAEGDVLLL